MIINDGTLVTYEWAAERNLVGEGKNKVTLDGVKQKHAVNCLTGPQGWVEYPDAEYEGKRIVTAKQDEKGDIVMVRKHGNVTFEVTA